MAETSLLEGLNKEQILSVTHRNGPLLIVAGAGTGKTTVITRRIAWLIEQGLAKPNEILALTFTEKAAAEMEERVDRLLPYGYLDLWISTFHAFGRRILESHGLEIGIPTQFKVLSETELWILIRQNLEKFNLRYYRPLGSPSRFIHALIAHFSRAKDELITPTEYVKYAKSLSLNRDSDVGLRKKGSKKESDEQDAELAGSEAERITEVSDAYAMYQKLLYDSGALDYGDLIQCTYELLRKRPAVLARLRRQFKYVLIDEFQDTNIAQYELVRLLAQPANNITVVGDDDQSIYKFRGASVSNILKFKDYFPESEQVTLTANYRSYQHILDLSYKFIQGNNPDRLEKKLAIDKRLIAQRSGQGDITLLRYADYHEEADCIVKKITELKAQHEDATWNDFAILVRANETAEPFVECLERAGVPYMHLARKGLYRKPVIASLLAYFRLLDNYHESRELYRVLNMPRFQVPAGDLAKITDFSHRKTYSLYEAIKHPALAATLSEEGQKVIVELLKMIERHTELARTRSAQEAYIAIVEDLGLGTLPENTAEQVQNLSYLDQFNRKIKDFLLASDRRHLRDFMEEIDMELSAGELGSLEFDTDVGPEALKVITVHSAKGLEFRFVFLPALVDQKFPARSRSEPIELPEKLIRDILPSGDFHIQEERRLFYVAMTRARDCLFLSMAGDYGGTTVRKPSIFIKELGMIEEDGSPTGKVVFTRPERKAAGIHYPIPKSFSFTGISTFRKCPLEYKYHYLLRVPEPGAGPLSFGQTIHRTLEQYLKLYRSELSAAQGELFGDKKKQKTGLPPEKKLLELYEQAWIDDWYEDKANKENYRKKGKDILKIVYRKLVDNPPVPKYIEQNFKLGLKNYLLTGKIDRADETPGGLVIIDYKTGVPKTFAKVDREQLLIYQWAAVDFLREKVAELQYWYFDGELVVQNFLGSDEQIESTKAGLLETIEQIVEAAKNDNFHHYHKKHQNCEFEHELIKLKTL